MEDEVCYRLFMFMTAGAYRRVGLVHAMEMFCERYMSRYNLGYNSGVLSRQFCDSCEIASSWESRNQVVDLGIACGAFP